MSPAEFDVWKSDLSREDDKVAGSARRRLVARGPLAVGPLLATLQKPLNTAQYRGVLRVLGDIAAEGNLPQSAELRRLLLEHLRNHDAAERRSVITCLGRLGVNQEAEAALLALWEADKRDDQLRVLATALGRVGSAAAEAALASCASRAPLVLREAAKGRADIRSRLMRAETGHGFVRGDLVVAGVGLRLRCRAGLGALLLQNLPATVRQARETSPGQIDVELYGSLNSLLTCRLWSEIVLRVDAPNATARGHAQAQDWLKATGPDRGFVGVGDQPQHPGEAERAAADPSPLHSSHPPEIEVPRLTAPTLPPAFAAALAGEAGKWLRNLTEGPPIWRLHLPNASRGELLDLIRAAQIAAPELPNSPHHAVWELRPGPGVLEIRPVRWHDARFDYLQKSIPAMTHAPLAAALALLSQPRADDVVWDPFCGAGTELAERAQAGPYTRLIGSDRDPVALDAARTNLREVERLALHRGDALDLRFEGVNVLLTNPPYGRKVQGVNAARLLRGLLEKASRAMPRGRIVWCSPLPRETWKWAGELGWKTVTRLPVGRDDDVVEAQVFVRE